MQSILSQLDTAFRTAIRNAFNVDADPAIAPSATDKFGDYQSNAAMGLAKTLPEKSNPRQVAEKIKASLQLGEMISEEPTIAGPGFINIKLNPLWLTSLLQQAGSDPHLGVEKTTNPQTVVIDYSGPNIAKQMHVGHLRSTIIGDAISRVIEFQGDNVIRQNHIGDWGTQFGMLTAYYGLAGTTSPVFKQEGDATMIVGSVIPDLEAFYREAKKLFDTVPEFQEQARKNVVLLQAGNPILRDDWTNIVNASRHHFDELYGRLNVKLERKDERGESAYNSELPKVVEELKSKSIAVESEGAIVVFADGPDKAPLIIKKSDGGYLYGTTDLAAIRYRINELHANRIIYTHDSRQAQHFRQVFDTARKASWTRGDEVKLDYAPFGTMLGEDGKPFKSRSGDTIKLKELLDEAEERALKVVTDKNPELLEAQRKDIARAIGIGAVKYADLSKDRISDYVFSWDKMLAMDGNTAPYLQYVYARIRSIFRKAGDVNLSDTTIKLDTPYEVSLAKHLLRLGEVIESVARELKPHLLCTYLYDLATRFSSFYENCPVLKSEEPLRSSRLALSDLTARTMGLGLDLLGIEHPEQM
ncbi:MAG TPA: arginine--tRNA ligase [Tepidisphaeraceae bacterium]|jgi:arginyl-tRNA synthetase|nr:arginine--tRNA ligase [Tepidisphaeraceae bacterium]